MQVKKTTVQRLIKEETLKIQKLITLQEERKVLVKQINEVFEEDMDEGFLGLGKLSQKTFDKRKNDLLGKINKIASSPRARQMGYSLPHWATSEATQEELAYVVLASIALGADAIKTNEDGSYQAISSKQSTNGSSNSIHQIVTVDELKAKYPNYSEFTGEAAV